MRELTNELFLRFSLETGILDTVKENIEFLSGVLLILAIITCFFGFYVYRAEFSVLVFIAVTLICCFIMRQRTDWGTITTTFAVLGTALAFFAYRWHRFGGFVICATVAGTAIWIITQSIWIAIIASVLSGIMFLMFPVIMISLMTSLWGMLVIYGFRDNISFLQGCGNLIFLLIMVAGFTLQMIITRKQKIFVKSYPRHLEHWIKGRRNRA